MSQRLFSVGKVGLFLDSYRGGVEKRKGNNEVKVLVMQLRVQPFDAKLATAIDTGIGEDSNVRAMLFDMNHADPKAHVERVNFTLGCPRQTIEIFASPDTETSRVALDQVKISGTYARTEKGVNGFAWVFTAAVGPVGRDEQELIHDWLHTQRFCTFQASEPLLDLEEVDDEEGTDADIKAQRPAPMWEDEPPAEKAAATPAKKKREPVRQRTISHTTKKKATKRKAARASR